MIEKLDDVWVGRDYPMLREITRRIDAGEAPRRDVVAAAIGLDDHQAMLAADALARRGLIVGQRIEEAGIVFFTDVAGSAYLMTGLHPDGDDLTSTFIGMLRQAADETADEDERGRLRRAADAVVGVSRDVMVGVMTAYASQHLPH